MPITNVNHYGLLDEWRQFNDIDIWHFNQIAGKATPVEQTDQVWTLRDRDVLARTFNRSFWTLAQHLSYPIAPVWIPQYELIPLQKGIPYQRQKLQTKYGWIESFGQRATSVIQAGDVVNYCDEDNDEVSETATVTVTTTVAADEIKLFYRVADGAPSAAHELWEIEPISVTKSGNVATITAHRSAFVQPSIIKKPYDDPNFLPNDKNRADTETAANFVDAVDVYHVYNDTTGAVTLLSDPILSGDYATASYTETVVSPLLVDREMGIFSLRTASTPCPTPEYVRVYYRAGYPMVMNQPDWELMEALTRLTNANMPQRLMSIHDTTVNVFSRDRDSALNVEHYRNNPYGMLEGQVSAWRIVERRAQYRAAQLTINRRIW